MEAWGHSPYACNRSYAENRKTSTLARERRSNNHFLRTAFLRAPDAAAEGAALANDDEAVEAPNWKEGDGEAEAKPDVEAGSVFDGLKPPKALPRDGVTEDEVSEDVVVGSIESDEVESARAASSEREKSACILAIIPLIKSLDGVS